MQAYLRVEKNVNSQTINAEKGVILDLYLDKIFSINDLSIRNPNYSYKKNEVVSTGGFDIDIVENILYKPKIEIHKNINSNVVFAEVSNIGKLISDSIDYSKLANIPQKDNFVKTYKYIIELLLNEEKAFRLFLDKIFSFIDTYGIPMVTELENINTECNILDFLLTAYLIYEAFLLRYNLANMKKDYQALFKYINPNPNDSDIFNHINNILNFLDDKYHISCSFESTFDVDNECWNTNMIFDDAIKLAIYELKIQLSQDNNSETIGICKNVACNRIFTRIGFRQQYCSNYDCIMMRQNQRKRKSRQKNKTNS